MRISQIVISFETPDIKYSKRVFAFTEQGVAMLAGVLKSPRADEQFRVVFEAINELMIPPEPKKNPIGFHVNEEPGVYRVRKIS